ncbi:hypothetical protein [Roseibium album]|uniref:hypothetical protein n=1 Tax=Roseibium album TaxID=311410 RepID=UPI003BAFE12B
MTAAVYNQAGEPHIPALVWTAVLGLSVAAHLVFLIYGLPQLTWQSADPPEPVETKIVIQSEDLVFESADAVKSVVSEAAIPDAAAIQANETAADAVIPLSPEQAIPNGSETVRPEATKAADTATVLPETLAPFLADSSDPVAPEQLDSNSAQPVSTPSVDAVAAVAVETISEQTPEALEAANQQTLAVTPPETVVVAGQSNVTEIVQAAPEETALDVVQQVQDPATPESQIVETLAPTSEAANPLPVDVAAVVPSQVQPADISSSTTTRPAQSSTESVVVASQTVTPSTSSAVVTTSSSTVAPVSSAPVASSPVVVSSNSSASQVSAVVVPSSSASPVQVQSGTVKPVRPVEEQIAAVQPSEVDLPALNPSDPNPSNVPAAPVSSDPTANVPPDEVATIDPLANVSAYVANYDAGNCAHLSVMSAGTDTARVTAFGSAIDPFVLFDQRFTTDQGYGADIEVRLVTGRQCALLDALGVSNGVEAPGLVELDRTVVTSGTRVSGVIQRDLPLGRIAQAEEAGLELDGKGPPELYLIDDAGQIHDGRSFVRVQTSTATLGGWRFSIPVTLITGGQSETALILAVWNRPKQKQPGSFGRLPAERIANVLASPGVYSLSAFKVSR